MSDVDFKKWQCRISLSCFFPTMSQSKKYNVNDMRHSLILNSICHIEFKIGLCHIEFKIGLCRMSLYFYPHVAIKPFAACRI